jgi:cardiolipin synthase
VFVPLIRSARRNITLSMAYFIPQGRILRALVRARRRGITIRVIVPGKSDVRAVQCATRHFYAYLLKRGFRIYEQGDYMLHSKVMVVDQEWSVVGSCNLDPRSLRFNLEFVAVIHARSTAAVMKRICHYEMQKSRRVTEADVARRSWWQRLTDRLAWSFRKWL